MSALWVGIGRLAGNQVGQFRHCVLVPKGRRQGIVVLAWCSWGLLSSLLTAWGGLIVVVKTCVLGSWDEDQTLQLDRRMLVRAKCWGHVWDDMDGSLQLWRLVLARSEV